MSQRLRSGCLALSFAACVGAAAAPDSTERAPGERERAACDYGIAVAFAGDYARAESAFVWLLAKAPGDARALTNLGNLNLMRGESDVALAFYERAAASDTADAGILLNEATALLLVGEDEAAAERASVATRRAGGAQEAARLLGLRVEADVPKAAGTAKVSQEEILGLLRAAAAGVPADSVAKPAGTGSGPGAKPPSARRAPVWRSAAARAGSQEAASILYWKR